MLQVLPNCLDINGLAHDGAMRGLEFRCFGFAAAYRRQQANLVAFFEQRRSLRIFLVDGARN